MNTVLTVREPIWKSKSVGISEVRMKSKVLDIYILYKNRAGVKEFPNPFRITREAALKYPTERHGEQVLHIIPIKDLTEIDLTKVFAHPRD